MSAINIGATRSDGAVSLPLAKANRHGLVTGSTGGGKTATLQRMAEMFSRNGVPVFASDVKGDLSGIAVKAESHSKAAERAQALGQAFVPHACPTQFWDLFGANGLPIHTSVQSMGAELLSRMLRLNETQAGTMAIAFRKANDDEAWMLTLDDLRWTLNDMLEDRADVCAKYGNITASSISAIQRNLLALEAQGGDRLFGEPPFDVMDFMRLDARGHGMINLLHADQLMEAPKLYATFLLWLLTELFRKLPEVGDIDKPKLVFFFDEAHLLFNDAPKPLILQVERLVRLVRSKGVGVFFVTQSPADVPDTILAQLGSRIQHALRAYTPKDQRMVKASAQAFRPNKSIDVKSLITELGVGQALISVLDEDGTPSPVQLIKVYSPQGQMGPISDLERQTLMEQSDLRQKYAAGVSDLVALHRFTRRQKLARGLEAGPEECPPQAEPLNIEEFVPDFSEGDPRRYPWIFRSFWNFMLVFVPAVTIVAYVTA